MNVREHLLALSDELRRLKADGRRTVSITDDSLAVLRSAVAAIPRPAVPAAPAGDPVAAPGSLSAGKSGDEDLAPVSVPASVRALPARSGPPPGVAPIPTELPLVVLPEGDKRVRWEALRELVLNHPVCRAHVRPGKQVVLGVGSLDAKIFFCGEAPGAEEEVQGEPFVGPAGQLLTRMIQGMGLRREDVYIGNIMNWRPEMPVNASGVQFGNRPPTPEELAFCLPFLRAQLAIVQPQLIVALGATAAGGLLGAGTFKALGEIRGRWHTFSGIPLMVTYHPSYILRNQSTRSKRMIWEDLLQVMERAGLPVSEKQRGYFLG
ncbi:MAG: uracil-DNA glycosylase [Opitutales bacterium]